MNLPEHQAMRMPDSPTCLYLSNCAARVSTNSKYSKEEVTIQLFWARQ